MSFLSGDWRERRNVLNRGIPFGTMHYSIANYSTDSQINMKSDMKAFEEDILTKIHSIPDPLKKNLADTVITANNNKEKQKKSAADPKQFYYEPNMPPEKIESPPNGQRNDPYQPFTGITNFISNFFGAISGAMFHRRARSPVPQYYDCFECDSHMVQEMSPDGWQMSKSEDQNKTIAPELLSAESNDNMNNCKAAAAHCEDKLNAVRSLLKTKTVSTPPKLRSRRARRVFADPGSIEDNFEDEFVADNFVSLANEEYIEYFPLPNIHKQEFTEIDAAKMKTEIIPTPESTDIVKVVKDIKEKPEVVKTLPDVNDKSEVVKNLPHVNDKTETTPTVIAKLESEIDSKKEIISSCEDKMAKLKSLLLEKRKKPKINIDSTASAPEPEPVTGRPPKPTKVIPIEKKQDKKFKNPNRLTDKRKRSRMRKNIQDDMVFANEIDSEEISSVDSSPVKFTLQRISEKLPISSVETGKEYFDEVKGRFHSASTTDSDDSFQIVFTDSPKQSRIRQPSDCDSEDSFIVFEESPDSCYTSNEVFGDHLTTDDSDNECSDSDSDISDSGCGTGVCKLSHTFSRTISDLTDNSLYEDTKSNLENTGSTIDMSTDCNSDNDEVDCAVRTLQDVEVSVEECESVKPGLLLDEAKKLRRKDQPPKKVTFSEKPPKVHVMRVWAFAARQARAGHWERHALDRERFKRRIADVDMAVSWVLKPQHRSRVMFQRFMPWWNALKRKEAAEKKQKAEEEKIRMEQERKEEEERAQRELEESKNVEEGNANDKVEDEVQGNGENKNKEEIQEDLDKNINSEINTQKEQIKSKINLNVRKGEIKLATDVKNNGEGNGNTKNNVRAVSSKNKNISQNVSPKNHNDQKNSHNVEKMPVQTKDLNKVKIKINLNKSQNNVTNTNKNNKDIIAVNAKLADLKINNYIVKENLVTEQH